MKATTDTGRLQYLLWISWRYHQYRADLFERLHLLVTAVSAVSGTAAFVALVQSDGVPQPLALWASAIVALAQTLNLVLGFTRRAQQHLDLRNQYSALHDRLSMAMTSGVSDIQPIRDAKSRADASSPSALNAILAQCHIEYEQRAGKAPSLKVGLWARAVGWFWQVRPALPKPPPSLPAK